MQRRSQLRRPCVVYTAGGAEAEALQAAKRKADSSEEEEAAWMVKVPRKARSAYMCSGAQAVQEPSSADAPEAAKRLLSSIAACATAWALTLPPDLQTPPAT